MRCAIDRKNRFAELESHPNLGDHLFISSLDSNHFDENKFFSEVTFSSLPFLIKIAKFSPKFAALCENSERAALWKQLYSILGLVLIKQDTASRTFYTHNELTVSHFTLVRGTYYFYRSQEALKSSGREFSDTELYWVNQAMKFGSIHATQRYLQFLYQRSERVDSEDAEKILNEAIKLSKTMLEQHGSYAYMMMAEAYYRYALWAQNNDNLSRARAAFTAAVNACVKAENYLDASQFSIYNASLGEGLKASNTLGIEQPRNAIRFLKLWAIDNLQEKEPQLKLSMT